MSGEWTDSGPVGPGWLMYLPADAPVAAPVGGAGRTAGGDAGKPIFSELNRKLKREREKSAAKEKQRQESVRRITQERNDELLELEPVHYQYDAEIQLSGIPATSTHLFATTAKRHEFASRIQTDQFSVRIATEMMAVAHEFWYKSSTISIRDERTPSKPTSRREFTYEGGGKGLVKRKMPMQADMLALIDSDLADVL